MIFGHTWRYIVWGKPGNTKEFLQDMEADRIPGLDISMGMVPHNYFGGLKLEEYFPVLKADDRELELKDNSRRGVSLKERLFAQSGVFDTMLELASDIKRRGFLVTINGKRVEEAAENYREIYSERSKGIIPKIL